MRCASVLSLERMESDLGSFIYQIHLSAPFYAFDIVTYGKGPDIMLQAAGVKRAVDCFSPSKASGIADECAKTTALSWRLAPRSPGATASNERLS